MYFTSFLCAGRVVGAGVLRWAAQSFPCRVGKWWSSNRCRGTGGSRESQGQKVEARVSRDTHLQRDCSALVFVGELAVCRRKKLMEIFVFIYLFIWCCILALFPKLCCMVRDSVGRCRVCQGCHRAQKGLLTQGGPWGFGVFLKVHWPSGARVIGWIRQ